MYYFVMYTYTYIIYIYILIVLLQKGLLFTSVIQLCVGSQVSHARAQFNEFEFLKF